MRYAEFGCATILAFILTFTGQPFELQLVQAVQQKASSLHNVGDIALDIASKNKGIALSVEPVPELDAAAVRVNITALDPSFERSEMIRVVLQCLSALAPYKPTLIVFSREGKEKLLIDGKDLPDIAFQYDHDKPIPAWRMFAERASRPDGSKIQLPDGLLASTTASFSLVDELMEAGPGERKGQNQPSAADEDEIRKRDTWKPTDGGHGEAVSIILKQCQATQLRVKDGTRIDFKQVDSIFRSLVDAGTKVVTNAKVALQQREQGGIAEVPSGSSELIGLQLRYREIFSITNDDMLFPLTDVVVLLAPESTFAGLNLYGKHGETKTRITGKSKFWYSGVSSYSSSLGSSGYSTCLQTDAGTICPGDDGNLVRWRDIKDKIAFDTSRKKLDEDTEMERSALSNAH